MKIRIIALLFTSCTLMQCAKFVPPTGGAKDITPPKLLSSIPANKSTNFEEKSITLEFDEIVNITSLKQELLVTPELKTKYKVKTDGKGVKLNLEKSLDSNTTYTFNFRKGIKDVNEGNATENLKIVFSTGKKIDSLKLSGKVEDLFTKKGLQNVLVGLYAEKINDTIPILKRKPTYFIKTDSLGKYQFENIKNQPYQLIYFTDNNNNLFFDEKKEKFGFKKEIIKLDTISTLSTISIYPYDTTAPKIKRQLQRENTYSIQFDENLKSIGIQKKDSGEIAYSYLKNELIFYKLNKDFADSLEVEITAMDSLENQTILKQIIKFSPNQSTTITKKKTQQLLKIFPQPMANSSLRKIENITLKFDQPIVRFDSTKIEVTDDTLKNVKFKTQWIDNNKTGIIISTIEPIKKAVKIKIEPNTFQSYMGDTNSVINLTYPLVKKEESGVIEGRVGEKADTTTHYIIQLIKEQNNELIEEQISDSKFKFENVIPDTYIIRVIEDKNKNNRWDSGNFYKSIYPEKIYLIPNPIKVKENFEISNLKIEVGK